MNLHTWKCYFEENREARQEPDWSLPCPLSCGEQALLGKSLALFQLGESGGGKHLLQKASGRTSPVYQELLRDFLAEEAVHADLLAKLVKRFGGKTVSRHGSHACFSLLRRALDFEWEVQILMSAELVGTSYYYHLGMKTKDPILREACRIFYEDELQHLAFHLEALQLQRARKSEWSNTLWRWQFKVMLHLICRAAWLDHGPCMKHFGTDWRTFLRKVELLGAPWLDPKIDLRLWHLCIRPSIPPAPAFDCIPGR